MTLMVIPKTKKEEKVVKAFHNKLSQSVKFVNKYKNGKAKAKSLKQLLSEL